MSVVHVVGNLCRDTTFVVDRFPAPGETMMARSSRVGLGGKGLNQAVAAARAGAAVTLWAAVAEEDRDMVARDIDEPGLELRLWGSGLPTDTSAILVRPDGENMIVSATASARIFDPLGKTELGRRLARGDVLLMQGNLSGEATQACVAAARDHETAAVLNPSPLWSGADAVLCGLDWIVANEGEIRALGGKARVEDGAEVLLGRGIGGVVVTRGSAGALALTATERIAIEAPRVSALDASGAGDVFCGVFAGLIAGGSTTADALARATAAASLSVTRPGALASCPTAEEIRSLEPPPCRRRLR